MGRRSAFCNAFVRCEREWAEGDDNDVTFHILVMIVHNNGNRRATARYPESNNNLELLSPS